MLKNWFFCFLSLQLGSIALCCFSNIFVLQFCWVSSVIPGSFQCQAKCFCAADAPFSLNSVSSCCLLICKCFSFSNCHILQRWVDKLIFIPSFFYQIMHTLKSVFLCLTIYECQYLYPFWWVQCSWFAYLYVLVEKNPVQRGQLSESFLLSIVSFQVGCPCPQSHK